MAPSGVTHTVKTIVKPFLLLIKMIMIEKNDAEKNLLRVHEWTRAADQKISIILAFQGVFLAVLFPMIFKWYWKNNSHFMTWEIFLLSLSGVLLLLSVWKSFSAVLPRISNNAKNKSITFFGHIASESFPEYKKRLEAATDASVLDDLISQTHISAGIVQNKYLELRHSMISFAIGISILIVIYAEFVIRRILC